MKGYFKSLAKRSGVAAAGGSAAPGRPLRIRPERATTGLHVESVDLINSTAASEDPGSLSLPSRWSSLERGPGGFQNEHRKYDRAADASASVDQQLVESENRRIRSGSPYSFAFEAEEGSKPVGPKDSKDEQRWPGKGGVLRVGEHDGSVPHEFAGNQDSSPELAQTQKPDYSMPPEDLESIREWLASPPNHLEAIQNRGATDSNLPKVLTASEDIRSFAPSFSDRESGSQTELQEFSLSIGSISVVVEQPAQSPPDRSATRRPVESQSATAQLGVRDTFALSRSYFRGF